MDSSSFVFGMANRRHLLWNLADSSGELFAIRRYCYSECKHFSPKALEYKDSCDDSSFHVYAIANHDLLCLCASTNLFLLLIIMPQPFEGCFTFVKDITDFLEKLITWPRDCGRAISDCATRCPTPF